MPKSLPKYDKLLADWLKKNGYDGLYCLEDECGCLSDDLVPCGNDVDCVFDCCVPGFKRKAGPDSEYDWIVGPKEEPETETKI
jgi:hypothetical protein